MNRKDLKDYKYNHQWIKGRFEYLKEYKTSIESISNILSDIPKGSGKVNDSMAEKIAILIDNINELLEKVVIEDNKQKQILEQLQKIEQPYRLILEKVYIQGKSLVTVANEMNYSYENICRKNGRALRKFEDGQ